jgi:hypothetical protein
LANKNSLNSVNSEADKRSKPYAMTNAIGNINSLFGSSTGSDKSSIKCFRTIGIPMLATFANTKHEIAKNTRQGYLVRE